MEARRSYSGRLLQNVANYTAKYAENISRIQNHTTLTIKFQKADEKNIDLIKTISKYSVFLITSKKQHDWNTNELTLINMKSEHIESVQFSDWLKKNGYKFTKSPNETFTKSWNQKRKNKAEWVSAGFPDYTIILKRKSLLFIEMKKERGVKWGMNGSVISQEQTEWVNALDEIPNVSACFCHWFEEAKNTVKKFESV